MSHKGLGNNQYTLADWREIPEDFICRVVQAEGKRIMAEVLGIPYASFTDWFKYRKIDIKLMRNFNYYNSRKKPEDRLPYETVLSYQLKSMLDNIRAKRLEKYNEKVSEEEVTCPTCGKVFRKLKSSSQKYCSLGCLGKRTRTEEELSKLSESTKGRSAWNKGIPQSAEAKAKFHETIKKVWTPEKRKEQSEIQKEAWSVKELRDRHSNILKEVNNTPEIKKKISDGLNRYYSTVDPEVLTERYRKQVETKNAKGWTYTSEGENALISYVKELGYKPEKYVYGKGNTRFEIDCYIPELKIGIEYNGIYYHASNGSNKKPINYHFKKSEHAMNDLGIELIHIWEDQWKKQNAIVKDILRVRLKKVENRIPARKCIIKEIPADEYRDFCITHHIQRFRTASVRLGLYYNDKLIQIASFGKPGNYGNANSDKYEWEWIRACTEFNTIVIGGTSKLFKYFIDIYKPSSILCYTDWNLFNGNGYEKLGFELLSFTGPDLFFIHNSSALERINRNPYANNLHKQMVKEGKLFECHGCGSKKFVWYASN